MKSLAFIAIVAVLAVGGLVWAANPTQDADTDRSYGANADYSRDTRYLRYDNTHYPRWASRDRMCDHNWFTRMMPWHRGHSYSHTDHCY